MSMLTNVKSGKEKRAYIITEYGPNGVGKSSWAAKFPKPLFADLEKGSFHLNVDRLDNLESLDQFKNLVTELLKEKSNYETFVVDSVEALEALILDSVKKKYKVDSVEDIPYGKGFSESREVMTELMHMFRKLTLEKNITVILIGHSQVKTHTDPGTNVTYDRYIMRCGDKMASVIRDLSDHVFFISHKVYSTEKNGKTQAFSTGQRVIYTEWRNSWDAKNRLDLPYEMPLSYEVFAEACLRESDSKAEDLVLSIEEMYSKIEPKLKATVKESVEKFRNNPEMLTDIKNRLQKYANA